MVLMDAPCHLAVLSSTDSTGFLCTYFAGFLFANLFSPSPRVLIALLCCGHLGLPWCQVLLFQLVAYLAWLNL